MLPFKFIPIDPHLPRPFRDGHVISTLDLCGIFLCHEGEVEVSFGDKTYLIRRGDMYIYAPSTLVRLQRISDDTRGVMVEVQVSYILPVIYRALNVDHLLLLRQHPCVSLPPRRYTLLADVLHHLYAKSQSILDELPAGRRPQPLQQELLKALGAVACYEVMAAYLATKPLEPVSQGRKDALFAAFMQHLFRHYRQERDVAYYAHALHVSPRYFSTLVRQTSGKTPLQWIVEMVITDARLLLEDSELSIKEVADKLNFPTQSFFGRYFKQYVGVSPKEYRKQVMAR